MFPGGTLSSSAYTGWFERLFAQGRDTGQRGEGKGRKGQPTHCSPTCGGQMYRRVYRAPFIEQKFYLNKTQLS